MSGLIVIDTNVVSAAIRDDWPSASAAWFSDTRSRHVVTAITVMELVHSLQRMPDGGRRDALIAAVDSLVSAGRTLVLPLTARAATLAGAVRAAREAAGRPMTVADAQTAGICLANGAALATRNVRDFEGVGLEVINPWDQ